MVSPPSDVDVVAASLVDGLRAQLPASGFALAGVEIELGALLGLDGVALAASVRRLLPGVEVQVTIVAGLLRCLDCGAEYPVDEFPCPACGSPRHEFVHGEELQVKRAWGAQA